MRVCGLKYLNLYIYARTYIHTHIHGLRSLALIENQVCAAREYVYVNAFMWAQFFEYKYIHICTYMQAYMDLSMGSFVLDALYMLESTYTHTCTHTHTHTHTQINDLPMELFLLTGLTYLKGHYIYIYTYIYIYIHIYIYIYINT